MRWRDPRGATIGADERGQTIAHRPKGADEVARLSRFDQKVKCFYIFRLYGWEGGRGEDRVRGGCTLREVKGFSPNNPIIIR